MGYTLDAFCRDCAAHLRADPGKGGKERVRKDLERLLAEKAFVAEHCGPDAAIGIHVLYRDPELGFCVLAHINREPRSSPPHDHGSSWAIYGQATVYTDMTEYRRLMVAAGPVKPGSRCPAATAWSRVTPASTTSAPSTRSPTATMPASCA